MNEVQWVKIKVDNKLGNAKVDGIEMHYQGYSGAMLRAYGGKSSGLYILSVIRTSKSVSREYSTNPNKCKI
jgi:hypothetical protein